MRILQVITDTNRRGAQVFATDLAGAFQRAGHEVTTIALAPGSQQAGLPVEVLGRSRRSPGTLLGLRRRMRTADITIAHGSSTLLACALTLRPFVYRQISDTRFWAAGWPRRLRVAAFLRRARHVVALSDGAARALVEHVWMPAHRITVVPNGVPASSFPRTSAADRETHRGRLGISSNQFVALYIGALVPEKGVDLAVRAVAGLADTTLLVAGGGTELQSLESLAAQLDAPVRFLGVLDDARPAYAAADVNVLPSRGGDSMPATLIEAGLCGLPSIATPIGSIEDVVVNGRTGLIVSVDDVAALRRAITYLKGDEATRSAFGIEAAEHCLARFDIDVVASQWLGVLQRATNR